MKPEWDKLIQKYNSKTKIEDILKIINEKRLGLGDIKIFPRDENIFKCFDYCDINDIKVVIIGQDPYHGPDQATGLSFAVPVGQTIPPSLRNIIKELKSDLNISLENTTLEHWARQGVLMLNASLSVIQGKPASQMAIWSDFTDYIISELDKRENIIFVAWGAFAHNKIKNIDLKKHNVIISSHPSPLSCNKLYKTYPAFNGSKPFSQINKILEERNSNKIDW